MHLLTVNQYAKLKGISAQAVYGKIKRKKIPVRTIQKTIYRIPVKDMESLELQG